MQTSSAVRPAARPSSAPTPCKNIAKRSFCLGDLFVVVKSSGFEWCPELIGDLL